MVTNLELSQGPLNDKIVLPTAVREISWSELLTKTFPQFIKPPVEKFLFVGRANSYIDYAS